MKKLLTVIGVVYTLVVVLGGLVALTAAYYGAITMPKDAALLLIGLVAAPALIFCLVAGVRFFWGALVQAFWMGVVLVGIAIIFASAVLTGQLPSNPYALKTAVGAGLIMGPIVVVGTLATINRGGVLALIAKIIAFLVTGTVIVLARFQAEKAFGEELGGELCLFSTFLLFGLVGLTSLFAVIRGVVHGETDGGKEFWMQRRAPFASSFLFPGGFFILPLPTLLLLEAVGLQPAVLGRLESVVGQINTYEVVIWANTLAMAGGALVTIPTIVWIYFHPWFKVGKGNGEASFVTTLWIMFLGAMATTALVGSYLLVQKAGMNLWVQQVGSDTTPFYWGLGFTAATILVTSLVAWLWVRVKTFEL